MSFANKMEKLKWRWFCFKEPIVKIKRILWNKHILLWWYRLWIRKNEFHVSLEYDLEAMFVMNKKELEDYKEDIYQRRDIAHRRDMEQERRK